MAHSRSKKVLFATAGPFGVDIWPSTYEKDVFSLYRALIGPYQTDRPSSKTDRGTSKAERLRHLEPIKGVSGL